jgi:predicted nicotinamide N-methyase
MRRPREDERYTRLQVPGLPGVYFRDQRLELHAGTLSLYTASAVDVLGAKSGDCIPYWCVAWPAGLALARYLSGMDLAGRTVLEVGSGVGISGLGAALAGAEVLITDNVPAALRLALMNARRSGVSVRAAAADWRAWPVSGCFDLVVGSDVTYEPAAFDALMAVLDESLANGGEVLLTDPGRLSASTFQKRAIEAGWSWRAEPLPPEGRQPVFLYTLHRVRRSAGVTRLQTAKKTKTQETKG